MKTPSNNLFLLIKSLSPSEKRYFKLFSALHSPESENRNYMRIFDAISALQEPYDENEVKAKLKNKVPLKNFKVAKSYISEVIIKSLESFYSKSSTKIILRKLLNRIEILLDKKQYQNCANLILKAEALAKNNELNYALAEILYFKSTLASVMQYTADSDKSIEAMHDQLNKALVDLIKENDFRQAQRTLALRVNKYGYPLNDDDAREYNTLIAPSILQEENATSFLSGLFFYYINGTYHFLHSSYQQSVDYFNKAIKLMDEVRHLKEIYIDSYIRTLSYICSVYTEKGDYSNARKVLKKLNHHLKLKGNLRIKNTTIKAIFFHTIQLHNRSGEAQPVPGYIESHPLFTKSHIHYEDRDLVFECSLFYYLQGDYRGCQKWLWSILNSPDLEIRRDIYKYAVLLQIFVLFERKDEQAFYYIKLFKKVFKKEESSLPSVHELVDFLNSKQLFNLNDKNLKEKFSEFKMRSAKHNKTIYENRFSTYIDVFLWVESRVQNKPYRQLLKEKLS